MENDDRAGKSASVQQLFLVSFVLMGVAAAVAAFLNQLLVAGVLGAGAAIDLTCMWLVRRAS